MTRFVALLLILLALPTHAGWYAGIQSAPAAAPTGIVVESGFPVWNADLTTTAHTTTTKTGISTAAASLIVVVASARNYDGDALVSGVTVGALSLTKAVEQNWSFSQGVSIWYGASSGALSSATATVTWTASQRTSQIVVYSITGAAASPVGGTGGGSVTGPGLPTTGVVVAASGSLLLAGFAAATTTTTMNASPTPNSASSLDRFDMSSSFSFHSVMHGVSLTSSGDIGNTITLGSTAPSMVSGENSSGAIVEIKAQ